MKKADKNIVKINIFCLFTNFYNLFFSYKNECLCMGNGLFLQVMHVKSIEKSISGGIIL